jgi:c-di-GMP-binding flagellar brake protein YcgR
VIRILPYGPEVLGALLDISEGGCGVEFGIAIPAQVGTQVEVDLNVRGERLKRTGVIRNINVIRRIERETRAGIEFVEVSGRRGEPVDRSAEELFRRL